MLQCKSNKYCTFLVCICSLRYLACSAHAPYYIVILSGCTIIFFTLSKKLHDFRGIKLLNITIYFDFRYKLYIELRIENWARCGKKCILVCFMSSTRYSSRISMKLEFHRQIFRKIHKCKISWKSVQWEPSCSMRTDGRDETNSRFSKFCERA